MNRLLWWFEHEARVSPELVFLTPVVVRKFLAYVREPNSLGRFGCTRAPAKRAARPSTVNDCYRMIRAFANWCREEGLLEHDPLRTVKTPRVPKDQLQPLSEDQCQALLNAARETKEALCNRAIVFTLLETGFRLAEVCSLSVGDARHEGGEIDVTGKGGKRRRVYLSSWNARRALRHYLNQQRADAKETEPLFASERGDTTRDRLTPNAVALVIRRLARIAGLQGV